MRRQSRFVTTLAVAVACAASAAVATASTANGAPGNDIAATHGNTVTASGPHPPAPQEGRSSGQAVLQPMPPTDPKHKSVPGSELPPPSQQTTKGPPGSIPPRTQVHLSLPMPKSGSSRGHLPAQFPSAIVPVPPGADIVASGLAVQGHRLQVTIAATSESAPQTVFNYYLRQLGSRGFGESASPTLGDAQAAQFTRDADALVVTVREDGKHGTSFSVAGVLTATQ